MTHFFLTTYPGPYGGVAIGQDTVLSGTTNIDDSLASDVVVTLPSYETFRITPHMKRTETGEEIPLPVYTIAIDGYVIKHGLSWRETLQYAEYLQTTTPFMAVLDMPYKDVVSLASTPLRHGVVLRVKRGRYPTYLMLGRAKYVYIHDLEARGIPLVSVYHDYYGDLCPMTIHRGNGIGLAFCYTTSGKVYMKPKTQYTIAYQSGYYSMKELYSYPEW